MELIDEPRDFAVEDLFFSTTDFKGHIQRANDVFRRISGYSWDQLRNKPHNIIRHPDTPRVVFQLLWDHIQAGRPIVAYVKNLAHDGRYYWVVALVVRIPGGYLSVRFKPTSPLFTTLKRLYSELRAVEAGIENESKSRKAAIAASGALLDTNLHALGFAGYDDFMQHLLKEEMKSREQKLRTFVSRAGPVTSSRQPDSMRAAAQTFDRLHGYLSVLFQELERYAKINEGVRVKSENVTEIAESLRVVALNGVLEADRLGGKAAGVRPVLDWLRSFSRENTIAGDQLSAALVELIRDVNLVEFGLGAAKLLLEMTAYFAHELADAAVGNDLQESIDGFTDGTIGCLHASSCETVRRALSNLSAVRDKLKTLRDTQGQLLESSRFLRPIYLQGKLEMAGVAAVRLTTVFDAVSSQLDETLGNLNGLKNLLAELDDHLTRGLAHGTLVEEGIAEIDYQMAAMARLSFAGSVR